MIEEWVGNATVSSLPGPGMVEVEEECDVPVGTWLTSALVTGRLVLLPLRLWEHLLPQHHVSHGGKSRFLLEQQSNSKMEFF